MCKEAFIRPTPEQVLVVERAKTHYRHVRKLRQEDKIQTQEQADALGRVNVSLSLSAIDAGLDTEMDKEFREVVVREKEKVR